MKLTKKKSREELLAIEVALARSATPIPLATKARLAHVILRTMERRAEPFGLFVILGWSKRWQRYAVTPDIRQDVFAGRHIGAHTNASDSENEEARNVAATVNFDGAILVDRHGEILHSGVMIEGLWPCATANKIRPGKFSDLSAQFGFKEKVHTRHLTAITASHTFKGTTVFTVSEESGSIHVFENGKILYETKKKKRL